jgi:hypothetical protein
MELAVSRGDGTEWTRPFRSSLGYPKFLDVNPAHGQFDSGTIWSNPQFMNGPVGSDTQRLFYGAYQSCTVHVVLQKFTFVGDIGFHAC